MLRGGHLRHAVKHLTRPTLTEPRFFHTGIPSRTLTAPHANDPTFSPEEESHIGANAARLFIPPELLFKQDSVDNVEFLNNQSTSYATAQKNATNDKTDVISAYLAIQQSSSSLKRLRGEAYARISKRAEGERLQQIMGAIAEDVLSHFPRESDPDGFSHAIISILSHATSRCPLSSQRVLRLYEALLISHNGIPPLDPDVVERIVTAALARPQTNIPPLEILGLSLLSLDNQTEEKRTKSIQLAYYLVIKVISEGEASYPRALRLFEDLVKLNCIPQEVQARARRRGGSFQTVITNVLVRSCLSFGWNEKAIDLLTEALRSLDWPRAVTAIDPDVQVISNLSLDVLYALLPSTSREVVHKSRTLITTLLPITSSPPPVEIPNDILSTFYESCFTCGLAAPAAHVYRHLQAPQIRQHHIYPPPSREALIWLVSHFTSPGISLNERTRQDLEGCQFLARTIFDDIVRRKHPVTLRDRPRLIALAAAAGFGTYVRRLWEEYTSESDRNRDVVRGSAHMLVPLVRLFASSQKRWDLRRKKRKLADITLTNRTGPSGDYFQFAKRVLTSYIEVKVPLATASQYDLNALARAQLLLGQLPEGIDTLSMIMDRGDGPQITDINVMLATLSCYSPKRAKQMIQEMIERGVQPHESTFSTVLSEALVASGGETEISKNLVSMADECGYGSLTPKGLASMVRSATTFGYTEDKEERQRQQWKVQWALNAVKTIMRYHTRPNYTPSDHLKTHAISISVGINCMRGSLRAMEPEIAFQFWRLLIKDRVLWDDREQKALRAWIARSVRYHWRVKRLKFSLATKMLDELGAPGVTADGPGFAKYKGC